MCEVKMLRNTIKKTLVILLSVLLVALCFSSCGAKIKLEFEKGNIVGNNDVVYSPVPLAYKPRTYINDDKYAKLDHPIYGKTNLYEVEGTNGEFLYCPADDVLYKTASAILPSLEMMAPTSLLISTNGNKELSLATLTDKETVAQLASLIIGGELNAVGENHLKASNTYKLSFISEKYPHIVYSVSYLEYSDGSFRIYDRDLMMYFEVGSEIHDLLNPSTGETTSSEAESTTTP